jgi:hypothetical protein
MSILPGRDAAYSHRHAVNNSAVITRPGWPRSISTTSRPTRDGPPPDPDCDPPAELARLTSTELDELYPSAPPRYKFGPAGFLPRDGSGHGSGFAEGGALDALAPGVALAGFADDAQAAVLPEAPAMTSGQLRAAVGRAVLAADPDAARRDREERLAEARVEYWTDPTGTASLAGRDLPSAPALAADKRLGQIARAWKKQGTAAGLDLLRARAYLALLLGHDVGVPPADLLPAGSAPVPARGAAASGTVPGSCGRACRI